MDKIQAGIHYIFSSYKRTAAVLFFAALFLSVPITISFLGNNQDIRQRASAVCANVPADIMLVIDRSESMSGNALSSAKSAAKSFVDIVAQNTDNKVGLVTFSSKDRTSLGSPLTSDFASVKSKIDSISANGETCTQCGIRKANEEISAHKRSGVKNVVILLTDGRANSYLSGSAPVPSSSPTPTPSAIPTTTPTPAATIDPSASPTPVAIPTGNSAICESYSTQLQSFEASGVCTISAASCQNIRNIMTSAGCTLGASTSSNVLGARALRGEDAAAQAALSEVVAGNSQNQTVFFTIGLGNNVSTGFLQSIATATGGKYFNAPNASDLASIYQEISQIVGKGSIAGAAFNDVNSNGTFDIDETGIPNLSFTLTPDGGTQLTATTDANGGFSFTGLCDASYNLTEETNTNWQVTTPANNSYIIALTNGATITGKDFANKPSSENTSPTPTPTPAATGSTSLDISLQFTGIGASATNSGQLGLNSAPTRQSRSVQISVFNSTNQLVASASANTTFEPSTGLYKGTVDLGDNFSTGNYLVKARADNTLWKTAPGIITINTGQQNLVPTFNLVSGDFDQDNQITILDYNQFISCTKSNTCKNVQ